MFVYMDYQTFFSLEYHPIFANFRKRFSQFISDECAKIHFVAPLLSPNWRKDAEIAKYCLGGCRVGWSDLALFAIFEKQHISADQVYF